jgi:hypothetical protein
MLSFNLITNFRLRSPSTARGLCVVAKGDICHGSNRERSTTILELIQLGADFGRVWLETSNHLHRHVHHELMRLSEHHVLNNTPKAPFSCTVGVSFNKSFSSYRFLFCVPYDL